MHSQDLRQKNNATPAARPVQLVLVRANGPLFYSITAASLLEEGMTLAADRLLHFFGADRVFSQWVKAEWLPRKLARAREVREYIQSIWPEYDWHAAHEQFRAWNEELGLGSRRPTAAHEALARCVASAQSGVFYRSLARWAEDRRLRALAAAMAAEEASSFTHFRNLYDRQCRAQGFGWMAGWSAALECVRSARDTHVPRAFMAVAAQCAAHVPFPTLEYPEFVERMASVIERHGDLAAPERMLLRTWKRRAHRVLLQPQRRSASGFSPVLRSAA
jgi:hypothetical protein